MIRFSNNLNSKKYYNLKNQFMILNFGIFFFFFFLFFANFFFPSFFFFSIQFIKNNEIHFYLAMKVRLLASHLAFRRSYDWNLKHYCHEKSSFVFQVEKTLGWLALYVHQHYLFYFVFRFPRFLHKPAHHVQLDGKKKKKTHWAKTCSLTNNN